MILLQIDYSLMVEECGKITNLLTVGQHVIASFTTSNKIVICNISDGKHVGTISGSGEVKGLDLMCFNDDEVHLMVVQQCGQDAKLDFYHVGTYVHVPDEENPQWSAGDEDDDGEDDIDEDDNYHVDGEVLEEFGDDVDMLPDWYNTSPTTVSLGHRQLVSYDVSPHKTFAPFTFDDGTITYILSQTKEDGDKGDGDEKGEDEDEKAQTSAVGSQTSDDDDDETCIVFGRQNNVHYFTPQISEDFLQTIPGLHASIATTTVHYYPIHNITCLPSSVHKELLLTVACTTSTLVVYEMSAGMPVVRVRKQYERAVLSQDGRHLVATQGGDVDVFRLYIIGQDPDLSTLSHFVTLNAHSTPITSLGIMEGRVLRKYIESTKKVHRKYRNQGKYINILNIYQYQLHVPLSPLIATISGHSIYTCCEDGSVKVWNLGKLNVDTPIFDRGAEVIRYMTCDNQPPELSLAVSYYPGTDKDRYVLNQTQVQIKTGMSSTKLRYK